MTVTQQIFTFEEYLKYDDGTDTRYELERGELIAMGQARGQHGEIMHFLERRFNSEIERLGLDWVARQAAVGVCVPQVGKRDTSRVPDVTVLPAAQWKSLRYREAVIELDEKPPLLVVEVVSTGTEIRDHRAKRAEYNIIGIQVYILVDFVDVDQNKKAVDKRVTVLTLNEGLYDDAVFRGDEVVVIPTFPELHLTANEIINAGDR
ncbi:MAG: Uma2 family endonuclease [Scytonematopsis contorta HA4267-MV1]|jgi:Uma2 family endonuclease|nr:Uma2 family endonuclease [Scytonematopsis contorta HA4267-MV1]